MIYSYSDYVFLCEFWWIVSFTELVHFISITTFVSIEFFRIFSYYPFNVLGISSDDPSFIFYITNFCLLFLLSLTKQFYLYFQKTLSFCCFLYFSVLVLLISALAVCLFVFLLLALCVIILFDAHIVPDLASGNFLKWMVYHFDLTWLVMECFLAEQDVCISTCTYPASAWTLHYLRKLVLVLILHGCSFLSFKLWTDLPQRISLFVFLWSSTEQLEVFVFIDFFLILKTDHFLI